jgi:hypothetical protein
MKFIMLIALQNLESKSDKLEAIINWFTTCSRVLRKSKQTAKCPACLHEPPCTKIHREPNNCHSVTDISFPVMYVHVKDVHKSVLPCSTASLPKHIKQMWEVSLCSMRNYCLWLWKGKQKRDLEKPTFAHKALPNMRTWFLAWRLSVYLTNSRTDGCVILSRVRGL